MAREKCVLAYSGGLDTSVAIRWIQENHDLDVIALAIDVGQERQDLEFVRKKALGIGAIESIVKDVREEYVEEFLSKALKANALYENKYPLLSAMSRPIIVKHLVEEAHRHQARYIGHGCTGKGNDQVRFEVGIAALDPDLRDPRAGSRVGAQDARAGDGLGRGARHPGSDHQGQPVLDRRQPVGPRHRVRRARGPVGRAARGHLHAHQRRAYRGVRQRARVRRAISFEQGVPVALDGEIMSFHEIINRMNELAGKHGFGRIDMIENRLIGVKSREIYEVPGALTLITAHKALEDLCLEREVLHYKLGIEQKWAELVYNGMWFSPLKEALDGFIETTQQLVTGDVRLRFFKGSCVTVGRRSPYSLYDYNLATYDEADTFDHKAAKGFIDLHGLPVKVWARQRRKVGKEGEV